jgi:hypothetical protein
MRLVVGCGVMLKAVTRPCWKLGMPVWPCCRTEPAGQAPATSATAQMVPEVPKVTVPGSSAKLAFR